MRRPPLPVCILFLAFACGGHVAAMFPPGSNYQGMTVVPLMSASQFLDEAFRRGRAGATDVKVVTKAQLTDIIEACNRICAPVDQQFAAVGLAPIRFDAAKLVVDYRLDGTEFREEVATVIVDMTGAAMQWNNARVDAEIAANRAKTGADIQHENYLMLTGQEEYINPYTHEVERDTNEYKHRWTDLHGSVVLPDDENLDPNTLFHNKNDFKRTKVRPRPLQ